MLNDNRRVLASIYGLLYTKKTTEKARSHRLGALPSSTKAWSKQASHYYRQVFWLKVHHHPTPSQLSPVAKCMGLPFHSGGSAQD